MSTFWWVWGKHTICAELVVLQDPQIQKADLPSFGNAFHNIFHYTIKKESQASLELVKQTVKISPLSGTQMVNFYKPPVLTLCQVMLLWKNIFYVPHWKKTSFHPYKEQRRKDVTPRRSCKGHGTVLFLLIFFLQRSFIHDRFGLRDTCFLA